MRKQVSAVANHNPFRVVAWAHILSFVYIELGVRVSLSNVGDVVGKAASVLCMFRALLILRCRTGRLLKQCDSLLALGTAGLSGLWLVAPNPTSSIPEAFRGCMRLAAHPC